MFPTVLERLQCVELHADGESEDVLQRDVAVLYLIADIEVARADLVK